MNEKALWRGFGEGSQIMDILKNHVGEQIIVFDTETTGLKEDDVIIQISAIKLEVEQDNMLSEVERLDMYINPERKLDKIIVDLTGITDETLATAPTETEAWPKIQKFFDKVVYLCGHNAATFDMRMLRGLYSRHGITEDNWICSDTMKMAQELYHKNEVGNFKLGNLAEHFGVNFGLTFHNSMDDVIATVRLLRYFIEEYSEKEKADPAAFKKKSASQKSTSYKSYSYETKEEVQSKRKVKIKNCWPWKSEFNDPKGGGPMERLYVKLWFEDRVLWVNKKYPYNWGEKDRGTISQVDMADIEKQVLALYGCNALEEIRTIQESKYASYRMATTR